MSAFRIDLERFEGDGANLYVESADYLRGKADGLSLAETQNSAKIAQSLNEVSSKLTDMAFGYQEARHHILEQMQPLVRQIADKVLPEIAQISFGVHLSEVINSELQNSASLPIQIAVAPHMLPSFDGMPEFDHCVFVADPNLEDGQALIQQDASEVFLDLPSLILSLRTALNALESPNRSIRNG